jgi:hypothetical protein
MSRRFIFALRLRYAHIFANAWPFWIGVLSVMGAVAYFIDPNVLLHRSLIGQQLKGWAYAWNALYLVGGLGMVIGILRLSSAIDVFGLCCFAGAILIQAMAVLSTHPPTPFLSAATFVGLFLAAVMRIAAILSKGLR